MHGFFYNTEGVVKKLGQKTPLRIFKGSVKSQKATTTTMIIIILKKKVSFLLRAKSVTQKTAHK